MSLLAGMEDTSGSEIKMDGDCRKWWRLSSWWNKEEKTGVVKDGNGCGGDYEKKEHGSYGWGEEKLLNKEFLLLNVIFHVSFNNLLL